MPPKPVQLARMEETLSALINHKGLKKIRPALDTSSAENKNFLNQITFFFGEPFFQLYLNNVGGDGSAMSPKMATLYSEMIRPETDFSQVMEDLLFNPENLPNSLTIFFDQLVLDILARDEIDAPEQELQDACNETKDFYLQFYQNNPSLFELFTPCFNQQASEAVDKINAAQDEYSKEAVEARAALRNLTAHVFPPVHDLSLEMLRFYKTQDPSPEFSQLVKFTSELFKQEYQMGSMARQLYTGDFQQDELLGFIFESHFQIADLYSVIGGSEKLRSEIKGLKTTREINDKVDEYFSSGLHQEITQIVETFVKPLYQEMSGMIPYATANVTGQAFDIFQGLEQVIAKSLEIAENFKEKYEEVKKETAEKAVKIAKAEAEEEAKRIAELEKIITQSKEMSALKEGTKKSKPISQKISYNDFSLDNGGLIEMNWKLKGDKSRGDDAYKKDNYRVLMSKEVYEIIKSSKEVENASELAVQAGFLPAGSKGDTGIKPMDQGEKVGGYVISEVKLTGKKHVKNFMGNVSDVGMGDIRLCGALKEGVLLITNITQHGKNNADLRETAASIAKNLKDKKIVIEPTALAVEAPSTSTSSAAGFGIGKNFAEQRKK